MVGPQCPMTEGGGLCGGGGTGSVCGADCLAYGGSPQDGQRCDGSQFAVGSPIAPRNENVASVPYYVTNISSIWDDGVIVAFEYQATTPAGGSWYYYFIQETNNGAKINFGGSIGVDFGPVNVGVSGGYGYDLVSPITWFFPGETKLPAGAVSGSCWPSVSVPS